ncbi:MAG TPA: Hsp20/alpha crystallin family protein [Albitalea sp.]|uniref:Hsp20/alpha crystallin family protein n=1 Tax=Piscinibacter sp. TaxID=1903157 RepID=UPI002ED3DFC3
MFVLPLTHSRRAVGHRAFDRLFDESLAHLLDGAGASRTPSIDVIETDTAYTVKLDVPGVAKEQLKVTVEGRRVSVETAEQAATDAKDGERVLYRERSVARYARTVSLPAEVDQATSEARFENGVLTLTLPKKVPTGARQISIN